MANNFIQDENLINPNYHLTSIGEIRFPDSNGISFVEFGAKTYLVGKSFLDSFCKMFNVSRKAVDEVPLEPLREVMARAKDRSVKIYVNDACATALFVMDHDANPIGPDIAHSMYEWFHDNYGAFDLMLTEMYTEFNVNGKQFEMFKDRHGIYRPGSLVHISHGDGSSVKILTTLEHCSSGHRAIINNKALCMFVPTSDRSAEDSAKEVVAAMSSVAKADRHEFHELIVDRLVTSRKTIASLKECSEVGAKLVKMEKLGRASKLNLEKVLDHYKIASPDERNKKWLAINPSHADRLQLFHLLVDTVADADARMYYEYCGDFLFTTGDLEGTNACRLWGNPKPKAESRDQDSDIMSDFGSHQNVSGELDNDDIQSFNR